MEHCPACSIEKAYHYLDSSSLEVSHASRRLFIGATAVSKLLIFPEMNANTDSHKAPAALQRSTGKADSPLVLAS